MSNYDHRAGGFVRPIVLGAAAALERQRESRVIHDAALLTVYLLMGVVALIFFAVRRREYVTTGGAHAKADDLFGHFLQDPLDLFARQRAHLCDFGRELAHQGRVGRDGSRVGRRRGHGKN